MLTCELCGEELLLEEDMRSHLLLIHLEAGLRCPLCSRFAESYEQLCLHISAAHPEDPARSGSTSGLTERPQTPPSCQAAEAAPTGASPVTRDAAGPQRNSTAGNGGSSTGEAAPGTSTVTPQTRQDCDEDCDEDGVKAQRSGAKQKRLCSPGDEERLSCPMCAVLFSSASFLQEHVELHLQEQLTAEGEKRLECPLCGVVCRDGFSLQQHVDLHLDRGAAVNPAGSDLQLARRLRQQDEAQQERDEFKKLQRQFGLDGSGGYSKQMERTLERAVARGLMAPAEFHCQRAQMMEALASGVDDGTTRTQGVVRALYEHYQSESKDFVHVWLSADTDHYGSSAGDRGWGCGYRNLQMLLSSLHTIEAYAPLLQEKTVPSIPRVQSMIEEAWRAGLDPQGASQFNQRLQRTRAWIGATEIYTLLTSLGIGARIIDFHKPTGPGDTHPRLFEWVKQYFLSGGSSTRLIHTRLPPLYLQHQGHSRSIVGLEQKRNGSLSLLLLDPGTSPADARKLLSSDTVSAAARRVRRLPGGLKHQQYQLVAVTGPMSAEERRMSALSSRTLCAERIP